MNKSDLLVLGTLVLGFVVYGGLIIYDILDASGIV